MNHTATATATEVTISATVHAYRMASRAVRRINHHHPDSPTTNGLTDQINTREHAHLTLVRAGHWQLIAALTMEDAILQRIGDRKRDSLPVDDLTPRLDAARAETRALAATAEGSGR